MSRHRPEASKALAGSTTPTVNVCCVFVPQRIINIICGFSRPDLVAFFWKILDVWMICCVLAHKCLLTCVSFLCVRTNCRHQQYKDSLLASLTGASKVGVLRLMEFLLVCLCVLCFVTDKDILRPGLWLIV